MIKPYIRSVTYFLITWSLLKYIWYDSRIIILSGDIETNPGPKHSFSSQGLKICHWNLNSLSSHMYKSLYCRHSFLFTNYILFVSQKLVLTPKLHLMKTIWKYQVTILLEKFTHLTVNVGEFAFIIKTHYLLK